MSGRIRAHLRSNIIAYCALFFALSGVAGALPGTNTVFSDDIVDGAVQTPDIANGGVATADLAGLSVSLAKLAPNAVASPKVLDNSMKAADLGPDSVGTSEATDESLGAADLAPGSVGSSEVIDESLTNSDLATDSVNTSEIADQTVTGTDLAGTGSGSNGFNGDEEIIDGSITGFDIGANQIGGGHIANGSLSGPDIAGGLASGAAQNAAVVTLAGGAGTDVVSGSITNESTSQIVINASAELTGNDADERALCRILLDGGQISLSYESTFDDIGTGNEATVAVNSFANGVAPGAHTVTMNCISLAGTVVKDDAGINAIAIP